MYKAYINPNATGKQLLRFSEFAAIGFAILAAAIAVGLNHAGFSVGFLTTAIGIFVDSAIIPMACTIMWKKQSKAAALISPLLSSAAGLIAWFVKAHTEYGEITIDTLSGNLPLVAGNMMSLCGPIILTPLVTYLRPEDFDWSLFKTQIKRGDDEHITPEVMATTDALVESRISHQEDHEQRDERVLLKARKKSIIASITLTLILLVLWPTPMYGTGYVFSKGFFKGWMVIVFLWAFFAASVITIFPIWEGRHSIKLLVLYLFSSKKKFTSSAGSVGGTIPGVDLDSDSGAVKEMQVTEKQGSSA